MGCTSTKNFERVRCIKCDGRQRAGRSIDQARVTTILRRLYYRTKQISVVNLLLISEKSIIQAMKKYYTAIKNLSRQHSGQNANS